MRRTLVARLAFALVLALAAGPGAPAISHAEPAAESATAPEPARTVRGVMQPRPGAPAEEVEVRVHEVPVEPPSVAAAEAPLDDDDLVLGVVAGGEPFAFPIRWVSMFEVVNDRVGGVPLAATW